MKLADLKPKWVLPASWSLQGDPLYIGLSWECRCAKCKAGTCPTCGHQPETRRLAAFFWPPIDQHGLFARYGWDEAQMKAAWCPGAHQRVSGETFDSLTLAPSIGLDPHWHGHLTNGEINP